MATLNETLEIKCLPAGYHTSHLPLLDKCDKCNIPIRFNTGKVYNCGHSYHDNCYNSACYYCLEYYKKGITKQVNLFKKGLESNNDDNNIFDFLKNDDINDDNESDDENNENNEIEDNNIDNLLQTTINTINQWTTIQ
ncbi:15216_t:CDS:1 [Dentiscutata heterogama]|uniref:15216_t:CDS:1 n=1 Tax=Dentiscutata heterogama TaxID=1316150 RepID=A0ACA9L3G6_9GLOM|nr:15216_t:CDS:1 [Dentiscutata heterogama]